VLVDPQAIVSSISVVVSDKRIRKGIRLGIGSTDMERVFSVVAGITEALVFAAIAVAMITVVWVAL